MLAFDFMQNIVLEDEDVLLRPLVLEDYDVLLQFALDEPELWEFSPITAAGSVELKNYIEFALESKRLKQSFPFIVWDKRMQKYAGSTRFYDIKSINQTLLLGYTWYGKNFQGTGINKRIKYLMLNYAFDIMNMQRVEFRADINNSRSIAAMKSIGCVVEGVLRSDTLMSCGRRRDTVVLSILKDDWLNEGKALLLAKI